MRKTLKRTIAIMTVTQIVLLLTIAVTGCKQLYVDYAKPVTVNVDRPEKARWVVNNEARKFAYVLRRDFDKNLPESILTGWSIEFCKSTGCSRADITDKTIHIAEGDGWSWRLRHEVHHALIFGGYLPIPNTPDSHHDFMSRHGWCYPQGEMAYATCEDSWRPDKREGNRWP